MTLRTNKDQAVIDLFSNMIKMIADIQLDGKTAEWRIEEALNDLQILRDESDIK